MPLAYQIPGLVLRRGAGNDPALVSSLQSDLRALGYLRGGIDGDFGPGTEAAVRALQFDLLHNDGGSTSRDGSAPVAIRSYNAGHAIATVDGVVDQSLVACIAAMLGDDRVPKLPRADDPAHANRAALGRVAGMRRAIAPAPFMLAMFRQESGGQHYRVPSPRNADAYVTVGLDRNRDDSPDAITSRGYGIGQYTLFHHPPTPSEMAEFVLDPARNVEQAFREFREKLDGFVVGPKDRADDRMAEHPALSLRICRYAASDPRFLSDCANCAREVRKVDIQTGTPHFRGARDHYAPTQYYQSAQYLGVPDRAEFACDWPYAVRRYNGSGPNSYHYQTRILRNLLDAVDPA